MVLVWIALNVAAISWRWDPYPFILLNLAFSTQAAYAAPLILLAQNRQENRDRVALNEDRVAPRRPRPTPNIWPASWPRCGWPSAEVPTREYLRHELEDLRSLLADLRAAKTRARDRSGPAKNSG